MRAAQAIGYVGAGTMEFLLSDDGTLHFMEMNTRLQVEHPVTEAITGADLVAEQIRVAAGSPLSLTQEQVRFRGHAIECRINAEDPAADFRPSPGTLTRWQVPEGAVRVDTHVAEGYAIPPFYDSLICKLIAHGATRDAACDHMIDGLGALLCEGVATTVPLHLAVLQSTDFRQGNYDTRAIPGWPAEGAA